MWKAPSSRRLNGAKLRRISKKHRSELLAKVNAWLLSAACAQHLQPNCHGRGRPPWKMKTRATKSTDSRLGSSQSLTANAAQETGSARNSAYHARPRATQFIGIGKSVQTKGSRGGATRHRLPAPPNVPQRCSITVKEADEANNPPPPPGQGHWSDASRPTGAAKKRRCATVLPSDQSAFARQASEAELLCVLRGNNSGCGLVAWVRLACGVKAPKD